MKQRVCLTAFICIVLLSTYACKSAPGTVKTADFMDEKTAEISYEVLMSGSNGRGLQTEVVETQEALDKLYGRLYGSDGIRAPETDFKKKKVIAVSAGTFNTGGYAVEPVSITGTKDAVEAVFRVTSPAPDQIVTQAFTYPYIIICITAVQSTRILVKVEGADKSFFNRKFEY
ncbi:dentilisin complex subunit PrcB [Treponema sp. OMZ 840]|uniref:dentilisin complex subunit PrcB n=1 Tax=Treponema sp. OMZ 840 TaxID=244313 RepID=UPI003D9335D7